MLFLLKAAPCMFLNPEIYIFKHHITARWDYKSESQRGKSTKNTNTFSKVETQLSSNRKKLKKNVQLMHRCPRGLLPPSSKTTLLQLGEVMSQLYSPPVSLLLWPLQPFAFGAPTSSLKQMETRQSKLLLVWIHNLSLQSSDLLFLLPRTLFARKSCCWDTFWSRVKHNSYGHAQLTSSQWIPVKDPFQMSAAVDWTQFPIVIHKLQWPSLWPRDKGQKPRPRSCRLPAISFPGTPLAALPPS